MPSYWQGVLRLPPLAASSTTVLQHDVHGAWGDLLMYGNEMRLFGFEGLLFAAVFAYSSSAALAGLAAFLTQRCIAAVRLRWGQENIARKALIDRRFLI